jgi:Zn ribbon nucleic-acid-binding protein
MTGLRPACREQEPIQLWDSDHTALVHVLWEAQHKGLTVGDTDELARLIMQSEWMRAVRLHAKAER